MIFLVVGTGVNCGSFGLVVVIGCRTVTFNQKTGLVSVPKRSKKRQKTLRKQNPNPLRKCQKWQQLPKNWTNLGKNVAPSCVQMICFSRCGNLEPLLLWLWMYFFCLRLLKTCRGPRGPRARWRLCVSERRRNAEESGKAGGRGRRKED